MINKNTQFKLASKIIKKLPIPETQKEEVIKEIRHRIYDGDIFEKENS